MFCLESTEVFLEEVRCFAFPNGREFPNNLLYLLIISGEGCTKRDAGFLMLFLKKHTTEEHYPKTPDNMPNENAKSQNERKAITVVTCVPAPAGSQGGVSQGIRKHRKGVRAPFDGRIRKPWSPTRRGNHGRAIPR